MPALSTALSPRSLTRMKSLPRPWYLANLTLFAMAQVTTLLARRLALDDREGKGEEEEEEEEGEAAPAASCCLIARCAEQQPGRIMRDACVVERSRGREATGQRADAGEKRERENRVCEMREEKGEKIPRPRPCSFDGENKNPVRSFSFWFTGRSSRSSPRRRNVNK